MPVFLASMSLAWLVDGLAECFLKESWQPLNSRSTLVAVVLLIVGVVLARVFVGKFESDRILLFLGASSWTLAPWAVSWITDGFRGLLTHEHNYINEMILIISGSVIGLVAIMVTLGYAVRGFDPPPPKVVSKENRLESDAMGEKVKVLIAIVGPVEGILPKTLLFTLKALPNLDKIIPLGEPHLSQGSGQVYDPMATAKKYCDDLEIMVQTDETVVVPQNSYPNDKQFDYIEKAIMRGIKDVRPDQVICDITGGSVPQKLALYDIARRLGLESIYVVAAPLKDIRWVQKLSETVNRDQIYRNEVLKASIKELEGDTNTRPGINLQFSSMSLKEKGNEQGEDSSTLHGSPEKAVSNE